MDTSTDTTANSEAFWQGFGLKPGQQGHSHGLLKDEKIVSISNDDCKHWIQNTTAQSRIFKRLVANHLSNGITDEILCTLSSYVEDGDFWNVNT